ncbi:hypothetical protein [Paenirhodobacter sp. CAU 1674]|uniref:hypothetical protein n=1 Tax=Paenirhodobacter sp. CAU 1674 TaxID=3032596 RepID=UPI0023DC7F68|nr:hypothetical protein [Paenirhodobacter sp. CAU 1674]MDF2140888.1 hypothetical protein [Paenirhodobacter sp. CAU 1674]
MSKCKHGRGGEAQESEGGRRDSSVETAAPPVGWYYFGPEPPWATPAGTPQQADPQAGYGAQMQGGADNADLMQAFDRLARGDLSAETLGALFNIRDRDFWKGAVAGSIAALALANLPTIKAFASMVGAQAFAAARPAPPAAAAEASGDAQNDKEI